MRISSNRHVSNPNEETELVAVAPRTQPLRAVIMPAVRIYEGYEKVRHFSKREQSIRIFAVTPVLIWIAVLIFWLAIIAIRIDTLFYVVNEIGARLAR